MTACLSWQPQPGQLKQPFRIKTIFLLYKFELEITLVMEGGEATPSKVMRAPVLSSFAKVYPVNAGGIIVCCFNGRLQ